MVTIARLLEDLERLGQIGALPDGGVSRPAFSREDLRAREFLKSQLAAAGLSVRVDAAGNIFGRRDAEAPPGDPAPAILVGSHIDTIEGGGMFDGALGVFGALEAVRSIDESGARLRRPVEVVAFTDEEERFVPFLGSRGFVGEIDAQALVDAVDLRGNRLDQALALIGSSVRQLAQAWRPAGEYCAFIELHIEQGPQLDRDHQSIGVVQGVKGDCRWQLTIDGRSDHAGAPKDGRADAFLATLSILSDLRDYWSAEGGEGSTFTVGRMHISPNIETVQPGRVVTTVDVRSSSSGFLASFKRHLARALEDGNKNDGIRVRADELVMEAPVVFDEELVSAIRAATRSRGYGWREMTSGAGHDAQVVGRHIPSAMIFVPSVDGRSHCPEELTRPEDIERGVTVLRDTILHLAR